MAKGSVRKKGKKWYYWFYVEDASGNSVQREFPAPRARAKRKPCSARPWRIMKKSNSSQNLKT